MRRFLKKANRGLLVGAFALILLVIYVIVDYSSFSNEKPKIKETLENYITNFYAELSTNDYEGVKEIVIDSWTDEPVDTFGYYYDDKDGILSVIDEAKGYSNAGKYSNNSVAIESISIKKSGPGMALAKVKFEAAIEYGWEGDFIDPFTSYATYLCADIADKEDQRYTYELDYECEVYLLQVDGEWKLSQASCWNTNGGYYKVEGE